MELIFEGSCVDCLLKSSLGFDREILYKYYPL